MLATGHDFFDSLDARDTALKETNSSW